ncbi:MAG: DUF2312 domain-containing protein [Bauldia sp.]|nr:DUF2312 domain-containing protein [Bauldia sp.]
MSEGGGIARDQLRSFVERIERLEEEKAAIADDVKAVYAEAKANGFDVKTLRQVIRIRKQDTTERQEQAALLDLYLAALGMLPEGDVQPAEAGEAIAAAKPKRRKPRSPAADFARDLAGEGGDA